MDWKRGIESGLGGEPGDADEIALNGRGDEQSRTDGQRMTNRFGVGALDERTRWEVDTENDEDEARRTLERGRRSLRIWREMRISSPILPHE